MDQAPTVVNTTSNHPAARDASGSSWQGAIHSPDLAFEKPHGLDLAGAGGWQTSLTLLYYYKKGSGGGAGNNTGPNSMRLMYFKRK